MSKLGWCKGDQRGVLQESLRLLAKMHMESLRGQNEEQTPSGAEDCQRVQFKAGLESLQ